MTNSSIHLVGTLKCLTFIWRHLIEGKLKQKSQWNEKKKRTGDHVIYDKSFYQMKPKNSHGTLRPLQSFFIFPFCFSFSDWMKTHTNNWMSNELPTYKCRCLSYKPYIFTTNVIYIHSVHIHRYTHVCTKVMLRSAKSLKMKIEKENWIKNT